jgi:hypothetical protein
MKAKMLSFVFISFSESRFFNGLQPIQKQKNHFPFLGGATRAPSCRNRLPDRPLSACRTKAIAIRPFRIDTTYFRLWQDLEMTEFSLRFEQQWPTAKLHS